VVTRSTIPWKTFLFTAGSVEMVGGRIKFGSLDEENDFLVKGDGV
jgi:hypothetical protein